MAGIVLGVGAALDLTGAEYRMTCTISPKK
jgi:hypothetical protein